MSFKKIKELRDAGKLDEALQMAIQALEVEPDNIWNKRAAAWVYYDFLKKFSQPDSYEGFRENLSKIRDLQLPEDEKMVFDSCAWQTGSLVFALRKEEPVDYNKINELFEIIRPFHFSKPSVAYSFLYKAFHKIYQNWSKYLEFADWWGFKNFQPEDYLKEEFEGKKIMSLAEQAYIAYSRKLLEGEPDFEAHQRRICDREKIQSFMPHLDELIEKHPDYQYPPYFKAKLLLALGDSENVLSAFLPFAKQKRNDFWVWELLSEVVKEEGEKIACLCKALSLNAPEKFTINTRQKLAEALLKLKIFDEAKTEIVKIDRERTLNNWKLPELLKSWQSQPWYQKANDLKDNKSLYSNHLRKAEDLLFSDIAEETVVVEFVNKEKGVLNFVQDEENYGFFKYSAYINNPLVGDLLRVRFQSKTPAGIAKVYSIKTSGEKDTCRAIKDFKGKVKLNSQNLFGFADDVYISADLIKHHNVKNDQSISGKAMLSFNRKKNEWGWKAFRIIAD